MILFKTLLNIDEHAEFLPGWEQTYAQLEPGKYSGTFVRIQGRNIALYREYANLDAVHTFEYDNNRRYFLIPIKGNSSFPLSPDGIYLLPRGDKIHSPAPAHYEMIILSVALQDAEWLNKRDRAFKKLPLKLDDYNHVYQELESITRYFMTDKNVHPTDSIKAAVKRKLQDIAMFLTSPVNLNSHRYQPFYSNSRFIVNACHAYLESHPSQPPTLIELCRMLRLSRRTLQYSFEKELGVTPSYYFRALRLNAVRRTLISDPDISIGQAAAMQGFFNQPYFTRSYRQLFLESASETVKHARVKASGKGSAKEA